jgi:transposase
MKTTDIIPRLRVSDKEKLRRSLRGCADAKLKLRLLVVMNLANGRSAQQTAAVLHVARSTVYRVAERFRDGGEAGLYDRREDNGQVKLDEAYLDKLYRVVMGFPQDHGWRRPSWTRELLVLTLKTLTGVQVHVGTMSRALRMIGARRGRPRPMVRCPWSTAAKTRHLNTLKTLLAQLPPDEVVLYGDEVDIHLNPKIGWDWMVRGLQKRVVTPGQNEKRYVAGALDAKSGLLYWVEDKRKNSALFVALLAKLMDRYPQARVVHVIVDNCRIHTSKITSRAVQQWQGRVILHFLPPYCPEENRIERVWLDLHAQVTRNHKHADIHALMADVRAYLHRRNSKEAHSRPARIQMRKLPFRRAA